MEHTSLKNNYKSYFAASNSENGFISYFKSAFSPFEYERIFILKGGPGTGKSTFMNRILNELSDYSSNSEAIFCSSDINSLDAAILERDNKKIAILDGTAPHTLDPALPGAVDEIINLADFWCEDKLTRYKREITEINKKKSEAYTFAYNYLKICGNISKIAFEIIEDIFGEIPSELTRVITENANTGAHTKSARLISSYSKSGFYRLNTLNDLSKKVYYVPGVYGAEYVFMDKLKEILAKKEIEFTSYPSPLFKGRIDAIFIPSTQVSILSGKPSDNSLYEIIDSSKFLDQGKLSHYKSRLEYLWHEREVMLWGAADEFKKASDEHFSLEKIYTAAMNFENEDIMLQRTIQKIKKIWLID